MKNVVLLIISSLFLVACEEGGGPKVPVTTELKNVTGSELGVSSVLISPFQMVTPNVVGESKFGTDIVIQSLTIPILDISLGTGDSLSGGSGNASTVYYCGTNDEEACRVELVGTDLTNLFDTATGDYQNGIEVGTYTSVMVGTCTD